MRKLQPSFYLRQSVTEIAAELLGKVLVTSFDGMITTARIVETEAYQGPEDRASHAFGGRRTNRTEVMYAKGGTAYVYLCYGVHHLFNVVTNKAGIPHAVLIRALEPITGIEHMLERRRKTQPDFSLTKGPGSASKAMGIRTMHTGISLFENDIWIADDGFTYAADDIIASTRIGVDYAGEHALWPFRFFVKGNPYVSGSKSSKKQNG